MKTPRRRLDQLLLDRGMVESREKSKALILAGQVMVSGQRVDKAGAPVPRCGDRTARTVTYVSRGGYKLAGALDGFGIDVTGLSVPTLAHRRADFDCLCNAARRASTPSMSAAANSIGSCARTRASFCTKA